MSVNGRFDGERRVVRLEVSGGAQRVRDSLSWRLPMGIPQCNLVASDAFGGYELLVSDQGTETYTRVRDRIDRMVARLNEFHPSDVPLRIAVTMDADVPMKQAANA